MKMIDKAKELAYLLNGRDTGSVDSKCKIITEWLEQNQPKPVVVGLSKNQVLSLSECLSDKCNDYSFRNWIEHWLVQQEFSHPSAKTLDLLDVQIRKLTATNKVHVETAIELSKEIEQLKQNPQVVGLSDEQVRDLASVVSSVDYDDFHTTRYDALIQNYLKTQTFTQSEVKEVVVGLSDEQVGYLAAYFVSKDYGFFGEIETVIKDWQKTQTFAQSVEFSSEELADSYQSLYEDFRKVSKELEQLKSQQVVGLSNEQVVNLENYLNSDDREHCTFRAAIIDWLKTQTFTQPSPVVVGLTEEHIRAFTKEQFPEWAEHAFVKRILDWQKTQTFAQPAIGITDSRPNWDDAPYWANWLACDKYSGWHWHKNKPFIDVSGWESDYKFLTSNENWKETLQQRPSDMGIPITEQKQDVKFDSWHNITPRFNMQPDEAVSCYYKLVYTDKHGEEVNVATYSNCAIKRPKPTQQVEVGQSWKHKRKGTKYEVLAQFERPKPTQQVWKNEFGEFEVTIIGINDAELVYQNNKTKSFGTRGISDFLAKFEQVQS
jgi:hypothetical protein